MPKILELTTVLFEAPFERKGGAEVLGEAQGAQGEGLGHLLVLFSCCGPCSIFVAGLEYCEEYLTSSVDNSRLGPNYARG